MNNSLSAHFRTREVTENLLNIRTKIEVNNHFRLVMAQKALIISLNPLISSLVSLKSTKKQKNERDHLQALMVVKKPKKKHEMKQRRKKAAKSFLRYHNVSLT